MYSLTVSFVAAAFTPAVSAASIPANSRRLQSNAAQPATTAAARANSALVANMGDKLEAAAAKQTPVTAEPIAAATTSPSTDVPTAAEPTAATTATPADDASVTTAAAAASKKSAKAHHKAKSTNVINKKLKALFSNTKEAALAVTATLSPNRSNNTPANKSNKKGNSQGSQERASRFRGGRRGYSDGYYSPWGVYRPYGSVSMAGYGGNSVCAEAGRAMACSFGRKMLSILL